MKSKEGSKEIGSKEIGSKEGAGSREPGSKDKASNEDPFKDELFPAAVGPNERRGGAGYGGYYPSGVPNM